MDDAQKFAINRALVDLHTVTKKFGVDSALELILGKLYDEAYVKGHQDSALDEIDALEQARQQGYAQGFAAGLDVTVGQLQGCAAHLAGAATYISDQARVARESVDS
jgi:hypothetical protein